MTAIIKNKTPPKELDGVANSGAIVKDGGVEMPRRLAQRRADISKRRLRIWFLSYFNFCELFDFFGTIYAFPRQV